MMDTIEENDSGFVSNWCKMIKLECGTLFVNPNLPDDQFFNKITNIDGINEKMLNDALDIFKKNKTHVFVYIVNNKNLEEWLIKKNFTFFDTQHVLTKIPSSDIHSTSVVHIAKQNSYLWTDIFCKSYDCIEWFDEVNKIVQNTYSNIEYLVDAEYGASCVALYEKNSILGLYCLGTIPERRNAGLAKLLIDYALNKVKINKLDFLMLETYQQDNLLNFYSKLGFDKAYEKRIYTLNSQNLSNKVK